MVGGAIIPGGIGAVIARFGIAWTPAVLSLVAVGCLVAFSIAARGIGGRIGKGSTALVRGDRKRQ